MHFDEEMGFQYLGPGITDLSPSDPRPPTVGGIATWLSIGGIYSVWHNTELSKEKLV